MTKPVRRCLTGWGDVLSRLPREMEGEVRDAYGERSRSYHDGLHVGGIWTTYLALGGDPNDTRFLLADAYHDLVYEVGVPKGWNEEASARRLLHTGRDIGLDEGLLADAAGIIRATGDHLSASREQDILFCDLDLSGFACDRDDYEDNTRRLRIEFSALPDDKWEEGRRAFLRGLAAHPRIFRTPFVPAWWEAKARENISLDLRND